jgi:hypothetical protein
MNGHPSDNELPKRTERDLARLADGSLKGRARARLEAEVAKSPELRAALERQHAGIAALRSLDIQAPPGLRSRVESEAAAPSRRIRRRRFAIGGALAGAAAAAALFAVLVLPSGTGGPTVVEAADLSGLPATQPSVPVDRANPKLLDAEVDGVPFPNLHAEFVWDQEGKRSDELDGRHTVTVFYERDGQRVGYTIVSGDPIDPPADSRASTQNGVELHTAARDGQSIVTWLRGGRTCVISGKGVSAKDLREVAAWKGDGAVPF